MQYKSPKNDNYDVDDDECVHVPPNVFRREHCQLAKKENLHFVLCLRNKNFVGLPARHGCSFQNFSEQMKAKHIVCVCLFENRPFKKHSFAILPKLQNGLDAIYCVGWLE